MNINEIELASELAAIQTQKEIPHPCYYSTEDGMNVYTKDAQEAFNKWYDYYLTIIEQCKNE